MAQIVRALEVDTKHQAMSRDELYEFMTILDIKKLLESGQSLEHNIEGYTMESPKWIYKGCLLYTSDAADE